MKISLRTRGGFTGPAGSVVRRVDTDDLPEGSREDALRLLGQAAVFGRPAKTMLASPRPQDFHYQLHVEDDRRSHQIDFHLGAVDAALRALVDWIEDHVEPKSDVKAD